VAKKRRSRKEPADVAAQAEGVQKGANKSKKNRLKKQHEFLPIPFVARSMVIYGPKMAFCPLVLDALKAEMQELSHDMSRHTRRVWGRAAGSGG
jgi:hypothetical protein